ncbi:hypothetical protein D3C86_2097340 [compost metagenome]
MRAHVAHIAGGFGSLPVNPGTKQVVGQKEWNNKHGKENGLIEQNYGGSQQKQGLLDDFGRISAKYRFY